MSEGGKKTDPWVDGMAGVISGCVECISVWPMEYIKTQLQLGKTLDGKPLPYNSIMGGLRHTARETGVASLWRGCDSALIGAAPKAGIRFGGNSWLKDQLKDANGKLDSKRQFAAGFGAGVIEAIVAVTPMETVKTQLIQHNLSFNAGIKKIYADRGLAGFYQGVGPTILKQGSNQGLRFMFFNWYKTQVMELRSTKSLSSLEALVGGMAAGCFSCVCNNPFDVVKTKMQGKDAAQYKGMLDCATKIVQEGGVLGLWKGCFARMGRVVPGQGVIFASFEHIQRMVETFLLKK